MHLFVVVETRRIEETSITFPIDQFLEKVQLWPKLLIFSRNYGTARDPCTKLNVQFIRSRRIRIGGRTASRAKWPRFVEYQTNSRPVPCSIQVQGRSAQSKG